MAIVDGKPVIYQPIQFKGMGKIILSGTAKFGFSSSPDFYSGYSYIEVRNKNSIIKIGNNFWANNNLSIISEAEGVEIGDNVLIGSNVEILDSDFHPLDPNSRIGGSPKTGKVIIGNNVFIGNNAVILRGVRIGDNSVIANNSLVSSKIPPNVVAGGNPCLILKKINVE